VYNSTLSGLISQTDSINLVFGSKNIEVRIPYDLNSLTTSFKKVLFLTVSHPEFEVIASIASGTNVT